MEAIAQKQTHCLHCDLLFTPKHQERFCCSGCESVHQIIQDLHLDNFYDLKKVNPPICPIPAQISSENFDYCDDPEFQKSSGISNSIEFYLSGINCSACIWLLEKLPEFCDEAKSATINMSRSTIRVERHTNKSFAKIAQAIASLGYRPQIVKTDAEIEVLQKQERRTDFIRIGVAAACAGNIMIYSVSLYAGATGALAEEFKYISAALSVPALTYSAWPFYKSSFNAIKSLTLNIDVPIVLAILAGIFISTKSIILHEDTIYFDSLTTLVFLLLSSRLLLKSSQQKYATTMNLEDQLLGQTIIVSKNGSDRAISSKSVQIGDVLKISQDQIIPIDGMFLGDKATISNAVLTGESSPITITYGKKVFAGAKCFDREMLLLAETTVSTSRLSQTLADSHFAFQKKAKILQLSDKVSKWFVFLTILTAIALVIYFATSDVTEGFNRALAFLIVTCPCVFGMAIPLSVSLALNQAAKIGVIIKNSEALERLSQVKSIFFDKTGTLTMGNLVVLNYECNVNDSGHLQAIPALEENQTHPIARALKTFFKDVKTLDKATGVSPIDKGGIKGKFRGVNYEILPIQSDGADVNFVDLKTSYALVADGKKVAQINVGDKIRHEANDVVHKLKQKNYSVTVLSGDQSSAVKSCAHALDLTSGEYFAQLSPTEKSTIIERATGTSLMIGDGANDSLALATATVGVAMHGSLDTSLKSADIYMTTDDLKVIPKILEIATETQDTIKRNLIFSVSFNLVSGCLAITGHMTPLIAAVLMPVSSLTVLVSALVTQGKFQKGWKI